MSDMKMISEKIVLSCEKLSKTFVDGESKVPVLDNVDLMVPEGELLAIVGSSGSGKSTLLHLLGGLDKPSSGTVTIAGKNIFQLNETEKGRLRNRHLGFVYQFHHLLPEFNALENVCMPLLIRGLKPKLAIEKSLHLIDVVGLKDRTKHRVGELSGGERQRIAIARALVAEPHCVLADEPTGNLDQTTAEHIFQLILQLNKDLKTSFIIVTHNRVLAAEMDRTLSLEQGHLNTIFSQ